MRLMNRSYFSVLALAALAACGGPPAAVVPPPATGMDAAQRSASGSTVAYEDQTLWTCGAREFVFAFSSHENGNPTPLRTLLPYWSPTTGSGISELVDCAAAPDGTMWFLLGNDAIYAATSWRLEAYAPGATSGTAPENVYDGEGYPVSLALAGTGVLVESEGVTGDKIRMYPYAANDPQPIRKLVLPPGQSGMSINNNDKLIVGTATGYAVYEPNDTGWTAKRTVAFSTPVTGPLAVGPDNTVYVFDTSERTRVRNPIGYIDAFPPGSNTAARRIGPIPLFFDPEANLPEVAITVDSLGRPYVLSNDIVYRYAPNANGNATPQRTLMPPANTGPMQALAIGP